MRTQGGGQRSLAFTLIELLVVIAIIAILASLLLPALSRAKIAAKVKVARTEMANLTTAITQYKADYSRFPASSSVLGSANAGGDFTFGTEGKSKSGTYSISSTYKVFNIPPSGGIYENCNAEVLNILTANAAPNLTYPGMNPNYNNALNPRKLAFFNAKVANNTALVSDAPGLDANGVLRDPFGNPYMISLDMNYDNYTSDAFYAPLYQKFNQAQTNMPVEVMIWTAGPDKAIDANADPNTGVNVNRDNITSW